MKVNPTIQLVVLLAAFLSTAAAARSEIIDLALPGSASAESGVYIYELVSGEDAEDGSGPSITVKDKFSGEPVVSFRDIDENDRLLLKFKALTVLEAGPTAAALELSDEGREMYRGFGRFFQVEVDDVFSLDSNYYVEITAINYVPIGDRHSVDIKVSPGGSPFEISLKPGRPVNIGPAVLELERVPSIRRAALLVRRPAQPFSPSAEPAPFPAGSATTGPVPRFRGYVNVLVRSDDGTDPLNTVISYRIASGDSRRLFLNELAETAGFNVKGDTFVTGEETVTITMDRSTAAEALGIVLRKGWKYTYDVKNKTVIIIPRKK